MLPIQAVLHPTDFSEYSQYAFRVACALARDYGARLYLLHVATPPVALYGEGMTYADPEGYEEECLDRLTRLAAQAAGVPVESRLVEGDPAGRIIATAEETGADLIVMGTHGRTGLGRLLMGSVAEHVVRRAPCPVLTLKTPFPGSEPVAVPGGQQAAVVK